MPGLEDPMSAINAPAPETSDEAPAFDDVAENKIQRAVGVSKNGDRENSAGIKLTDAERAEANKRLDEHKQGMDRAVRATLALEAAELRGQHDENWSKSVDELSESLAGLTDDEKERVRQRVQAERGQIGEKQ